MDHQTTSCPECQGTMHFRLGEYECDDCGKRTAAAADDQDERLPARRISGPPPVSRPNGAREFDVERGRRS
jgi:tRNA(Ile2) C34 agmatinyltransferase TiaS